MKFKHMIIPIFISHKGCPNDCVFCNQKRITGHDGEFCESNMVNMIEEYLSSVKNRLTTKIEIAFYGGSFTGIDINLQNKYLEIASYYLKSGQIDGIRLSTRPDYINSDILCNLKNYGVETIELGVQSFDSDVLLKSNRGHDVFTVFTSVSLIKSYGFKFGIQLMVGLPGDSYEKSIESAKVLVSLKPNLARIYPTLVIKDTELYNMYLEGTYMPLSLDEAIETSKDMYRIIRDHDINVIRIGLQPTDNIMDGKDVICGPFHPSFRHLVESRIYRDQIELFIGVKETKNKILIIYIKNKNISELVGIKKENLIYLKNKYLFKDIKISIVDSELIEGNLKMEIID